MSTLRPLPQLDGSAAAAVARLSAWARRGEGQAPIGPAAAVRACIEEASGAARGLASIEECANEACSKAGELEYLHDELGKALHALDELEVLLNGPAND